MPLEVPRFLVHSIQSISRFFYSMLSYPPLREGTPVERHLFPKYALATSWIDQLHGNEPHFSELLAGSFVHKLYFVKAKSGAQHEHVMAEIHNRDATVEPKIRFLRFERASGDLKTRKDAKRQQARTPEKRDSFVQEALDNSLDSSSESSKLKAATLSILSTLPRHRCLYQHDEYSLLSRQCYWWADTLMAIVESLVEEQYRVKTFYSDELVEDNELSESNRSGKINFSWVTIRVHNRKSDNIDNLRSIFDAESAYYFAIVLSLVKEQYPLSGKYILTPEDPQAASTPSSCTSFTQKPLLWYIRRASTVALPPPLPSAPNAPINHSSTMHAYFSRMPALQHEIPPYLHAGVSQLPPEAQALLDNHGLSLDAYTGDAVDHAYFASAETFRANVLGIFQALVQKRREVAAIVDAMEVTNPGPEYEGLKQQHLAIARHLEDVLLPEMHVHIDSFIEKVDALTWYEHKMWEGSVDSSSAEELELHRASVITTVIEGEFARLQRMDREVVLRDLASLEQKAAQPPETRRAVAAAA
ncbi:hypothetical protein DXG03_001195 [Asterophora parasitica]|uniref:Uncharacterized protein n=1 Tax=Asterophora parasitica TaxID=117018 RepID=A0A9P7G589_9AGAR|nr:hypothetical protein DXG03_001195 [Asterophora parasitica]